MINGDAKLGWVGSFDPSIMKIKWTKDFETGLPEIDRQHKLLVDLINAARKLDAHGPNSDDTEQNQKRKILSALAKYISTHFHYEEELLRESGYPKFFEHKASHDRMVNTVRDYQQKLSQGQISLTTIENLMSQWLINHILDSDRDYISYVKDHLKNKS